MSARGVRRVGSIAVASVCFAAAACGPAIKPPVLQVDKIKVEKARITGLGLDVHFRVQNAEPETLYIDRFEYELKLNGYRLGRGYYPEALTLEGFASEPVISHFQLNWLSLPGSVKSVLDHDRAKAEVKGKFYVRRGGGLDEIGFKTRAEVRLRR